MGLRSVNDLLTASQAILNTFQGQPWWRGQACENWTLVPKVYRTNYGPQYEPNIAMKFSQRAPTRHSKVPLPGDLARWLFLAQHYGLPTRLLDWTESPLIALYFAVWEDQYLEQPGAVWAMNPFKLNELTVRAPGLCQPGQDDVKSLSHRELLVVGQRGIDLAQPIVCFGQLPKTGERAAGVVSI